MVKVIAFVPVRGGSKSIPLKNIKLFCGKPLVYWNLVALQNSEMVDDVIVATDSDVIEETILRFGFSKVSVYRRLAENASDIASTESVMLEYLNSNSSFALKNDLFILVQATSPLTEASHYTEAVKLFIDSNFDSLLSCVKIKRFFWTEDGFPKNYNYQARPRRQDFGGEIMENGAFYINRVENVLKSKNRLFGNIGIYLMPQHTAVEIDEEDDWLLAEKLMLKYVIKRTNLRKIKLFLTDVDGVLTDAGMYYSENGVEAKKFNTRDGMAFELLRNAGIKSGIITSEESNIVSWRAKKLKVDYLYQSRKFGGKLEAAMDICNKENIDIKEVAYIGDDLNCLQLLSSVGLSACPSDAIPEVKALPRIHVLNFKGGDGAVREFVTKILSHEL